MLLPINIDASSGKNSALAPQTASFAASESETARYDVGYVSGP